MRFKKLLSYILILTLIGGLAACSDNGSGAGDGNNHGDPPTIPDLSNAQPDLSFFQDNQAAKQTVSSIQAYTNAKLIVTSATFAFATIPAFVQYMQQFNQQDAEYTGGMWVWSYEGAQNSSLRLTAKNTGDATDWTMYISGETFNNFKAVDGTIQNDGSSGVWKLYDMDTGNQILKSEFKISSDSKRDYTVTAHDEDTGSVEVVFTFDIDIPVHILTVDEKTSDNDQKVYWNSNTKKGYVIDNGDETTGTECWDGSLQDASCSDIGL